MVWVKNNHLAWSHLVQWRAHSKPHSYWGFTCRVWSFHYIPILLKLVPPQLKVAFKFPTSSMSHIPQYTPIYPTRHISNFLSWWTTFIPLVIPWFFFTNLPRFPCSALGEGLWPRGREHAGLPLGPRDLTLEIPWLTTGIKSWVNNMGSINIHYRMRKH